MAETLDQIVTVSRSAGSVVTFRLIAEGEWNGHFIGNGKSP